MTADETTTTWVRSSDGTKIALHDFGGEGPTLLICHATGFHAHCYTPMLPLLRERFHVWGVDVRGHGASQIGPEDVFVWDDFAADFLAAVDHIGGPVRAFGHSMGGCTVVLAEHLRPGTVERAWVYEPILFPIEVSERNSMMADNARRRRSVFGSRAEALHRYASRPPLGIMRADALHAYVEHGFVDQEDGTVRLACYPDHEALTFEGAGVLVSRVADVAIPIIVGCGHIEPGMPGPADFAIGVANGLPQAQLRPYDGLGHFGPMQQPTAIANDVVEWLS